MNVNFNIKVCIYPTNHRDCISCDPKRTVHYRFILTTFDIRAIFSEKILFDAMIIVGGGQSLFKIDFGCDPQARYRRRAYIIIGWVHNAGGSGGSGGGDHSRTYTREV